MLQHIRLILVLAIAIVSLPATSRADSRRVMVVPLSGTVPGEAPSLTARLSESLLQTIRASGVRGSMSRSSYDDLMLLHGCTIDDRKCLQGVAKTLGVDELLIGQVKAGKGEHRVVVELVRIRVDGAPEEVTFALRETKLDAQVLELEEAAEKLYPAHTSEPEPKPEPKPKTKPEPEPAPEPDPVPIGPPVDREPSSGGVKTYSWIITGVGLATVAAGALFWSSANGLQDDIDATDPFVLGVDELDQLRDLEDRAQTRYQVGNGLVIAGGVLTAVGATLIVLQARGSGSESGPVSIAPTVTRGGVGVAITVVSQ